MRFGHLSGFFTRLRPFTGCGLALLCCLMLFAGCKSKEKRPPIRSFYYWKTTFNLTPEEQQRLDKLKIRKLYLRVFDVDLDTDRQAVPVAPVIINTKMQQARELVPVVFITNRTIEALKPDDVPKLAERISQKVLQLVHKAGMLHIQELQLDCDWTETTRDRYFALVEAVKFTFPKRDVRVSATIRLHQVKYASRTGVPPADRGMLMFYNMGNLSDTTTLNSIFDAGTASQYLHGFDDYPLPLDIALPVFTWGVQMRRGQVIALLHNLRAETLENDPHFQNTGPAHYTVALDTLMEGRSLRQGDRIRIEETSPELALEAARLISPQLDKRDARFSAALYHWDPTTLQQYNDNNLEDLYSALH